MAYPATIDSFPTKNSSDSKTGHATLHNSLATAIVAIQTELGTTPATNYVHSTLAKTSGDLAIWGGSSWSWGKIKDANVASDAALSPSKLAGYPSDSTKALKGDGTWGATSLTLVTALPGSPTNGQETIYTDSTSAPSYYWHLRYNSTTTKWHFVGGSAIIATVDTQQSMVNGSWQDVATVGPVVTVPLAGDYDIHWSANINPQTGGSFGSSCGTSIWNGTSVQLSKYTWQDTQGSEMTQSRVGRLTGLSASTALRMRYLNTISGGSPGYVRDRVLTVIPVKVG